MAIDYTGITSIDAGAPDIKYTGDEGPKSPQEEMQIAGREYNRVLEILEKVRENIPLTDEEKEELQGLIKTLTAKGIPVEQLIGEEQGRGGIQMASAADDMLEEEYDKYVFEMQEMGQEPMSLEEFRQQAVAGMATGGRAGYKNGEMVTVPKHWQSAPDHPKTELAYITKAEKDLLVKKDLHNSLEDGPNEGPGGVMSLNGDWSDMESGITGADISAAERGETPKSMSQDRANDFRAGFIAAGGNQGSTKGENENVKEKVKEIKQDVKTRKEEAKKDKTPVGQEWTEAEKIKYGITTPREIKKLRQKQLMSKLDPRYQGQNYIGGKFNKNWWDMSDEEKDEYIELVESGATFEQLDKDKKPTGIQIAYDPYAKIDGIYQNPELQDIVANIPGDVSHLPPSERNRYRIEKDLMKEKIDDYYMGGSGAKQAQFLEGPPWDPKGIPGTQAITALAELFGAGKPGPKRNRRFFADPDYTTWPFGNKAKNVLEAGKYKYKGMSLTPEVWNRLSLSEQETVYDQWMADRSSGYIDAYGNVHPDYYRGPDGGYILRGNDAPHDLLSRNPIQATTPGTPDPDPDPDIPTGPVTDLDYTNQYYIPGASNFYTNLPSTLPTGQTTGITFDPVSEMLKYQYAADGGRAGYAGGGIADLRQGYFLGKLVKSITKPFKGITRGIKKLGKSKLGKAAMMAALYKFGPQILSGEGFGLGDTKKWSGLKFFGDEKNVNLARMIGIPMALGAFTADEDDDEDEMYKKWLADKKAADEYWIPRFDENNFRRIQFSADGGRIGYQGGGYTINDDEDEDDRVAALRAMYGMRRNAQEGGLMDLGGMEKDYRNEGGFVPIGGQERADDVPARLSKNEFVFTADAVRNAGGGDIDKGAEIMENLMENLEQGGKVSEESQGLEGARDMFATAQRLEGVL